MWDINIYLIFYNESFGLCFPHLHSVSHNLFCLTDLPFISKEEPLIDNDINLILISVSSGDERLPVILLKTLPHKTDALFTMTHFTRLRSVFTIGGNGSLQRRGRRFGSTKLMDVIISLERFKRVHSVNGTKQISISCPTFKKV